MSEATSAHASVMVAEILEALAPRGGGVYVDATLGRGGHAEAILDACAPDGVLLGIDRDPEALVETAPRLARFGSRARLFHGCFGDAAAIARDAGHAQVDGLLADLGVSSPQLDRAERGFSFRHGGPLDMRMDPTRGLSAREQIAEWDDEELADVIYRYGEERRSRAIARSIKRAEAEGALETTLDLARAIWRVTGPRRGGIDPATRSFQAIRIAVNDEVGELTSLLASVPDLLADAGVAALLTFHSLEDRPVKHAFRGDARLAPLWKKPRTARDDETATNPRARSAKLRAARRVPRSEEGVRA